MNGWEVIFSKLGEWINGVIISLLGGISAGLWYIQKLVAMSVQQIIQSNVWGMITEAIFDSLKTNSPSILRGVMFSNVASGGLIVIAIFFVAFSLIVPSLYAQGQKIARLEHVLVYAIVMMMLFIGGVSGYDGLRELERYRQSISTFVIGNFNITGLSAMVAAPMQATAAEVGALDNLSLPALFETSYLPDSLGSDTHTVKLFDTWMGCYGCFAIDVETSTSMGARRDLAVQGLFVSILNLLPTAFLLITGACSLFLMASAWTLVIFFVFSIPIGLFEFGIPIQMQILSRYTAIWGLTILTASLTGIVTALAAAQFDNPSWETPIFLRMQSMIVYIIEMGIAIVMITYVAQVCYATMTTSFTLIGNATRSAVSPLSGGLNVKPALDPNLAVGGVAAGTVAAAGLAVSVPTIAAWGGIVTAGKEYQKYQRARRGAELLMEQQQRGSVFDTPPAQPDDRMDDNSKGEG